MTVLCDVTCDITEEIQKLIEGANKHQTVTIVDRLIRHW